MMPGKPTISIIIVNYNVRDFLEQALLSLRRALSGIHSEIIVVDNASFDGSVQMLEKRFPEVIVIANGKNVGFSAANNQALEIAKGDYLVLLNPDTVVQEDTFTKLLEFFNNHPDASAASCKILNPDGTFSLDCRHSIPTPATAFWKLIGFSRLFPGSKIFGRYNLTYLDENDTYPVEAISGSFMMMKRDIVEKVGKLDEQFFMYCEDIDYCHRINLDGGKIYYVPTSQIIHYKGESTKKNNLDYVITFNKSLYLFYRKHYKQKYIYPFEWLILLGVILRGILIFFRNALRQYYPFLLDLLILNAVLSLGFYFRYELKRGFTLNEFLTQYVIVNVIASLAFYLSSLFFDCLNKDRYSLTKIIKANLTTFIAASAFTFFFRQFAFSRLVIFATVLFSPLLMGLWRVGLSYYGRKYSRLFGRDMFLKRTLVVGSDAETRSLLKMLTNRLNSGIEIAGVVALKRQDVGKMVSHYPVVSSLEQLPQFIRSNKINLVIFSTHNIAYERILNTMSEVQNPAVEFKMVPGHMEFMIGKSTIERLDSLPLVEIEYAYGKPFNRFVKRTMDIAFSFSMAVPMIPVLLFSWPFIYRNISRRSVGNYGSGRYASEIAWYDRPGFFRTSLNILQVLQGRLTFVGAPIDAKPEDNPPFEYKPGITGILQINRRLAEDREVAENLVVHYLKNQNLFLDLEILLKSIAKRKEDTDR